MDYHFFHILTKSENEYIIISRLNYKQGTGLPSCQKFFRIVFHRMCKSKMSTTKVQPLFLNTIDFQTRKRSKSVMSVLSSRAPSHASVESAKHMHLIPPIKLPVFMKTQDHIIIQTLTHGLPFFLFITSVIFLLICIWYSVILFNDSTSKIHKLIYDLQMLKFHAVNLEKIEQVYSKCENRNSTKDLSEPARSNLSVIEAVLKGSGHLLLATTNYFLYCKEEAFIFSNSKSWNGMTDSQEGNFSAILRVIVFHRCMFSALLNSCRKQYPESTFSQLHDTFNRFQQITAELSFSCQVPIAKRQDKLDLSRTNAVHIFEMYNNSIKFPNQTNQTLEFYNNSNGLTNQTHLDNNSIKFTNSIWIDLVHQLEALIDTFSTVQAEPKATKNNALISSLIIIFLAFVVTICHFSWKLVEKQQRNISMKKKMICDVEEKYNQICLERLQSEDLLHQMLPKYVVRKLVNGEKVEVETFEECTIYFSDIVGFNDVALNAKPIQIVNFLNSLYG